MIRVLGIVTLMSQNMEKKRLFPVVIYTFMSIFLLATSFNMGLIFSWHTINQYYNIFPPNANQTSQGLPRFAYLISGSKGDLEQLWRTLHAVYHPRNQYVVHLDLESPVEERLNLSSRVEEHHIFSKVRNVHMITKADMVTYRGPTMVSNTLHGCAILLKRSKDWDWFINLSASDYPLVTQDDLLHTFSTIDRNLNFIEQTSHLNWKADKRGRPLLIDPGLYSKTKEDIFWATPNRPLPTAFKLFTGSQWMVLTRSFVEYLIWGWDNLPRTLLMYYTNYVSSSEGYFPTAICNAPEFAHTAINHNLRYIFWGNPPNQHPQILTLHDIENMTSSGAAFARKFKRDDPVLDKIDEGLLGRKSGSEVADENNVRPGPGAERLKGLIAKVAMEDHCT